MSATLPKTWQPPPGQQLYALFDAAAAPDLRQQTQRLSASRQTCLWRGNLGQALADVAPYLVALTPNTAASRAFLGTAGALTHGYLCLSPAGLDALAAHFQRLITVAAPPLGSALHFRFHDARVWFPLLRHSTSRDLPQLFGPVTEFILCGDDDGLHRLGLFDDGRLRHSQF